ncbi:MAG TPA: YceI family protein [Pyrinomonadaceae bacterium]|nr:YceI family protein [Pyrinomonadaceae bacterium]
MKNFRYAIVAAMLAVLFITAFVAGAGTKTAGAQDTQSKVSYEPIPGGDYQIDPAHSTIGFSIRHFEINWVSGRFKDFKGTIRYNDADVTKSTVEFTAKIESIDTGVEARDKHLRTADFFDAAKYPEMTFKSTGIERKGQDSYLLHGDFTLKGVTKQITLPFTITGAIKDSRGNTRFGINAQTRINRRDYGITYGNAMTNGGLDVGNEVRINLQLEALKPAPKTGGQ